MVVLDATMLLMFLNPNTPGPVDDNGNPVPHAAARVTHLIRELERTRTEIVIPAPALSEALVRMGSTQAQNTVAYLNQSAVFRIEPFDQRAAIELAEMLKLEPAQARKRAHTGGAETYAKLKFDRQIVAIAKTVGVACIYSDDRDISVVGLRSGVKVIGVRQLPLPPENEQIDAFGQPGP
jgi:hypothetical protein